MGAYFFAVAPLLPYGPEIRGLCQHLELGPKWQLSNTKNTALYPKAVLHLKYYPLAVCVPLFIVNPAESYICSPTKRESSLKLLSLLCRPLFPLVILSEAKNLFRPSTRFFASLRMTTVLHSRRKRAHPATLLLFCRTTKETARPAQGRQRKEENSLWENQQIEEAPIQQPLQKPTNIKETAKLPIAHFVELSYNGRTKER